MPITKEKILNIKPFSWLSPSGDKSTWSLDSSKNETKLSKNINITNTTAKVTAYPLFIKKPVIQCLYILGLEKYISHFFFRSI